MNDDVKQRELAELRGRVERLERELETVAPPFRPTGFYTGYYATTGFLLGSLAAAVSLMFNVVGSALFGRHPLEYIRTFLTFPLGEQALALETGTKSFAVGDGLILAIGCCLYLGTGMLLGIPFQLMFAKLQRASLGQRFLAATALALTIWIVNFYGVLAWLQPALFGGNWIVERIPWWVAASTHLVFGWTMLLLAPLGMYQPMRAPAQGATP